MALPVAKKPPVSIADYLKAEEAAEVKSEYHDGEVLMMAGGTYKHSRISFNLGLSIGSRLRGHPCQASESNTRIAIASRNRYVYPDLTVICGQPQFDPNDRNQSTVTNPTLVAEVLSPSTELYDRGQKFDLYRDLPSLQEYVLISTTSPLVETFLRQPDGNWLLSYAKGPEAKIRLTSLNIELPLAEIYEQIDFEIQDSTAV